MMAKAKEKVIMMALEPYLKKDYEFTPYIHEISVMLPPLQTLILCNLINKLPGFNKQAKAKEHIKGKYHFKRNQNSIYEDELHISKKTYTKSLNELSKYITYFGDRKERYKRGYNTTYFYLNLDAIQELFNAGRAKLGKQDNKPQKQDKASQTTTPQEHDNKDNKDKAPKPENQQNEGNSKNSYPKQISDDLKLINKTQAQYDAKEIGKRQYDDITNRIIGNFIKQNIKIIIDKNTKGWKIM